jgi:hypothetical protein
VMSTSNTVDGRQYTHDGIFECKGTRQYTTPIGASRTVFVLHYSGATETKASSVPEDPKAARERWLTYWTASWAAADVPKPNRFTKAEWEARVKVWSDILIETLTGAEVTGDPDGKDERFASRIQRNEKYMKLLKKSLKLQLLKEEEEMVTSFFYHFVKRFNENPDRGDEDVGRWQQLMLIRARELREILQ